jgi:hypothetical protein
MDDVDMSLMLALHIRDITRCRFLRHGLRFTGTLGSIGTQNPIESYALTVSEERVCLIRFHRQILDWGVHVADNYSTDKRSNADNADGQEQARCHRCRPVGAGNSIVPALCPANKPPIASLSIRLTAAPRSATEQRQSSGSV